MSDDLNRDEAHYREAAKQCLPLVDDHARACAQDSQGWFIPAPTAETSSNLQNTIERAAIEDDNPVTQINRSEAEKSRTDANMAHHDDVTETGDTNNGRAKTINSQLVAFHNQYSLSSEKERQKREFELARRSVNDYLDELNDLIDQYLEQAERYFRKAREHFDQYEMLSEQAREMRELGSAIQNGTMTQEQKNKLAGMKRDNPALQGKSDAEILLILENRAVGFDVEAADEYDQWRENDRLGREAEQVARDLKGFHDSGKSPEEIRELVDQRLSQTDITVEEEARLHNDDERVEADLGEEIDEGRDDFTYQASEQEREFSNENGLFANKLAARVNTGGGPGGMG